MRKRVPERLLTPVAGVLTGLVVAASLAACGSSDDSAGGGGTPTAGVTCSYPPAGTPARKVQPPPAAPTVSGTVRATIATTQGDIPITLDADKAPCTVNSFVSLAKQGYFDSTPCHRLTTRGIHVLQCGDPTGTGRGGPGYSFPDELTGHETYPQGTLAMANAGANTNGSQFFLCYGDSSYLNSQPNYTVFGRIGDAGLQVLAKVARAGEDDANAPGDGHPNDGIKITRVTLS